MACMHLLSVSGLEMVSTIDGIYLDDTQLLQLFLMTTKIVNCLSYCLCQVM